MITWSKVKDDINICPDLYGHGSTESSDHRLADKLDQETQVEQSTDELDETGEEGQGGRLVRVSPGVVVGHDGHDGGGADGDLLGSAQQAVSEAWHEAGVEAVLHGQAGEGGVAYTLGYHGQGGRHSSYHVPRQHLQVVSPGPGKRWQSRFQELLRADLLDGLPASLLHFVCRPSGSLVLHPGCLNQASLYLLAIFRCQGDIPVAYPPHCTPVLQVTTPPVCALGVHWSDWFAGERNQRLYLCTVFTWKVIGQLL